MSHSLHEADSLTESCERCETDTPHEVSIEIRTEGSGENAEFSREPYRVTTCSSCGHEVATRMNDR
ncbi:DUF7835 family putative zinc beta-ribbon protein [Candidatus Halobonum tyrrellensis]|uniref:Small CPxCG-related zinc finger protein n=1 Tax=Candidatus Halobonum tyrrellensis G22 TaxID=1324957 RepID=V4HAJ8_9EURY|nr:hypothetical protein [Candidatus Halobonum tyrrellensis]ESP87730.1 small CPxCG-related zinc finger protein [Candidatus Halobonum tyrrellensis G22]